MEIRCPTCRKTLVGKPETFPFCSARCRDIDLGHWFEERYRIPARPELDAEEEELERAAGSADGGEEGDED